MSVLSDFPQTEQVIFSGMEKDLHRGLQIYVSQHETTLLDTVVGNQGEDESLTAEHRMLWLSSGKPLTAVALGVLHDQGLLQWDDSLSKFLPEWAMFGQPDVTLAQLLTHTAGFENRELGWPERDWTSIVAEVLCHPLDKEWPVGKRAGYVVSASWFLLGEVISRLTSHDFLEAMRTLVLVPLNLQNSSCGMSLDEFEFYQQEFAKMFQRTPRGLDDLHWDVSDRVIAPAPGGNFRGPIRELGWFYESMLPGASNPILKEETRQLLTSRQRQGLFDETFRHPIDWGYGVILNSNRYGEETVPYGFGRYAGESTFGHGGSQSSIGFADPEHGLVVAWATNGRIGEPRHHERNRMINAAIYRDLQLT